MGASYVIYTKVVQRFGYLDFLLRVKESIRKLFPFAKGALNNL